MKIELLDLALGDLIDGYHFYESQEPGLGSYFLNTLYSDIPHPSGLESKKQSASPGATGAITLRHHGAEDGWTLQNFAQLGGSFFLADPGSSALVGVSKPSPGKIRVSARNPLCLKNLSLSIS